MPYRRQAELVLAAWLQVERELAAVDPGFPKAEALQAEAAVLRSKYQNLILEARAAELPEPPPFLNDK